MEAVIISNALDAAGLPTPDAVTDAEAFAHAAAALVASTRAAGAPDLAGATAKTAAELVARHAEHVTQHPARIAAAERLHQIAAANLAEAWKHAAAEARPKLAAAFNTAADDFAEALAAMPEGFDPDALMIWTASAPDATARLMHVSGRLDALAACRDRYALDSSALDRGHGTLSDSFERITRHLHILDRTGWPNPPAAVATASGLAHWVAAVRHPAYRIEWQELDAQRANTRALFG